MRLTDLRDEQVPGLGGNRVLAVQESTFAFQDKNGQFAIQVMGVHREGHPGIEIEVDDLEIRGVLTRKYRFMAPGLKESVVASWIVFMACSSGCMFIKGVLVRCVLIITRVVPKIFYSNYLILHLMI